MPKRFDEAFDETRLEMDLCERKNSPEEMWNIESGVSQSGKLILPRQHNSLVRGATCNCFKSLCEQRFTTNCAATLAIGGEGARHGGIIFRRAWRNIDMERGKRDRLKEREKEREKQRKNKNPILPSGSTGEKVALFHKRNLLDIYIGPKCFYSFLI